MKILKINIKDDSYLNKFNDKVISSELHNYLIDKLKGVSTKEDIKIKINYSKDMNKENFSKILKNSFINNIKESDIDKKFIKIKLWFFLLIGVLGVLISFILSNFNPFISEVTMIIGWVGIWESVYIISLEVTKTKIFLSRYKQISNSILEFE